MITRFYYGSDDFEDGEALRKRGIQAIVQFDPAKSWYVESHGDYYLLKSDGLWHAADGDGLLTELKERGLIRPSVGIIHLVLYRGSWVEVNELGYREWIEQLGWVLHGKTIGNAEFQATFQQALAEADSRRRATA